MRFIKPLQTFTILFLITSSTVTFPALAAQQLDTDAGNDFSWNWFRNIFTKFLDWNRDSPDEISTASAGPPSNSENFLQSLKNLELASNEYQDNFDAIEYSSNFIQSSGNFITASENFASELEGSDSSTTRELSRKILEFSKNVKPVEQKAQMGSVTREDLKKLSRDISNARGKRYEKVEFDRYVEREIHPRVLGAGGDVIVAGGQLILPPGVNSSVPLEGDYDATTDAPITPEIQALADSLGGDPARIYWWVHENIRYVPYYGAMHGANQTLISRSGNDIDTASLLISLLRASGYPARYVYGIASATRNETFDLLGVDDVPGALRLLWGTGIPAEFDGVGFNMERIWVEVYAPVYPFLERQHWIQLDASWKTAGNYTKIDEYIEVNSTINATALYDGATENATINETEGYISGINITFIEEYLNSTVNVTSLQNITEEFFIPNETQIGERYFPMSMQFSFNKSYEYSLLPEPLKYKVHVTLASGNYIINSTVLNQTYNLTEIAGKPFVLDFAPSTQNDSEKLQNGTYNASEINMTPMLYLNDTHVNGTNVTYGSDLHIVLTVYLINGTATAKRIYAGEKAAIVIDAPRTEYMAYNRTFERIKALQNSSDNETYAREFLYLMGEDFFFNTDQLTDNLADDESIKWARTKPAIGFITKEKKVQSFQGVPINVTNGGTSVDLKFDQIVTSSSTEIAAGFNLLRGMAISGFEGNMLEYFYENISGISTAALLNKSIAENNSIFFVNSTTIDLLDSISIPNNDKDIINSLLNTSPYLFALIPNATFQIGNWSGTGYVIIDGETGAGKYLISGGLAGGISVDETPPIPPKDFNFWDVVCTPWEVLDVEQRTKKAQAMAILIIATASVYSLTICAASAVTTVGTTLPFCIGMTYIKIRWTALGVGALAAVIIIIYEYACREVQQ